jgi:hypothetical protein
MVLSSAAKASYRPVKRKDCGSYGRGNPVKEELPWKRLHLLETHQEDCLLSKRKDKISSTPKTRDSALLDLSETGRQGQWNVHCHHGN